MLYYSKDELIVATFLDTYHPKADSSCSVKIKVTYKRRRLYYKTGKSVTPQEWEILPTTKVRQLIKIRQNIENSFNKIRDVAEVLISQGDFSFDSLEKKMGHSDTSTINRAFENKIEEFRKEGRIGNMTVYKTILNRIKRFAGDNIPFHLVTPEWLKRYEKQLVKEGKSRATISIHMRTIRAVINDAKNNGLIKESQYPFGKNKFEIQEGQGRKLALTLEQIGQIANYECESKVTEKYRDIWMFIYLCNGINVADLIQLKYRNIVDDELYYIRQKTKHTTRVQKEIVVPLTKPMQEVIKKWGNPVKPDNFIFPILTGHKTDPDTVFTKKANFNRELNKRMAAIAEELKFPKVSSYTARHSFATVLKRSGANIAFISESLGHSDVSTTEHYLASFEKEERKKNAKLLLDYNKKPTKNKSTGATK